METTLNERIQAAQVRKLEAECELLEVQANVTRWRDKPQEEAKQVMEGKPTVPLGAIVRDTVTGFQGVAVTLIDNLNGSKQVVVQSRQLHDGKPVSRQWFDVSEVEVVYLGGIAEEEAAYMENVKSAARSWSDLNISKPNSQ